jgi:hypothetical protein
MRRSLVLLGALAVAVPCWARAEQALAPRTEVMVYPYQPPTTGDMVGKQFHEALKRTFLSAISQWRSQVSQIAGLSDRDLEIFDNLSTPLSDKVPPKSFREMERNWKADNALLILFGFINRDDKEYTIDSSAYFGPPTRSFHRNFIALSSRLSEVRSANAKDAHIIAILYALAMDSERAGLSPKMTRFFVSEALAIAGPEADNDPIAPLTDDLRALSSRLPR